MTANALRCRSTFPPSRAAKACRRDHQARARLDILVNNAGAAWGAEFDEFPESGWDKVMDLNVKSLFFLTKALAKPLRAAARHAAAGQGHQRRLDRRHLRQSEGDLFLRRQQGRGDPSDAAHRDQADQGPHQCHRDRAGRFQVGHEPRGARPRRRDRQDAFRRGASAPTRTSRALRSISPRAPATTSSATPSRSMVAWCLPVRGLRLRDNGANRCGEWRMANRCWFSIRYPRHSLFANHLTSRSSHIEITGRGVHVLEFADLVERDIRAASAWCRNRRAR